MRSNEFEKKMKPKLKLGEMATSMCFLRKDDHFTPAVLCIEPEFNEENYVINAIPALMYWDNDAKDAKREEIPFQIQKEAGIPLTVEAQDDESEQIDLKSYYVSIEKICCALDVDCVTPSMKAEYRKNMGFDNDEKVERIFWQFFPDAMEKLN